MRPKPTTEWVMREPEKLGVRIVAKPIPAHAVVEVVPVDEATMCERLISGDRIIAYCVNEPCPDDGCSDPNCMLGHLCKRTREHKVAGRVVPGFCYAVVKEGIRAKACLEGSMRTEVKNARKKELRKVDLLAFLKLRAETFIHSLVHTTGLSSPLHPKGFFSSVTCRVVYCEP